MRKYAMGCVAVLVPLFALGQDTGQGRGPLPRVVRASADAVVNAKPDHAQIRLGVMTQAGTAQAAAAQNAAQTKQVIDALKAAVGGAGEVKTADYSIAPQYQYGNNVPPKLIGYRASNTVMVEIDKIASLGSIIDASVKAGANDITGISFSLKNDAQMRQQAIAEAATKARANAEAIARALGVQVVGVWQAETTSSERPIRPLPMMARAAPAAEVSTPIETGSLEIHANVTVALQIR
jgi:uncharacterized protein YggE